MFDRMLVATDLSEASDRVIEALGGLEALGVKESVLLYCLNLRDAGTLAPRLMKLTRPALDAQGRKLEEQGFTVTTELALGLPHIEVNRQAEERGSDLVVIGSHGETGSGRIFLGGVAGAILHNAVRPLLVIRLKFKDLGDREVCEFLTCDFRSHVLFPTDFSANAGNAFRSVLGLADVGAAEITLMHVRKPGESPDERVVDQRLAEMKTDLESHGPVRVNVELQEGNPKKEIVERVNQGDISLVVMGSQGRGYVAEFFLGSVSHEVARRSKTAPVLLIPAEY
jgi:nucleotide-binding universal stress UspA family protein